jgi:serine/threonine protein kinase
MPENKYPPAGQNSDVNKLIGKSLGQFRIVDRIGSGGMATVYQAYQPNLDRYVAIKVLPAGNARDPIFVKRFEQEARSVAKLAHPNIVQIHDFGEQDQITYIVMEYVDGGTLKDRLKRPLAVPEAVNFVIQAAEGLECAHRNGIVHRDVKPANMLLRKDGHLLLSDFGIAKILEGTTHLTRVGTGIGTPQYMSPEQGMGRSVDGRSDIYSLGIVFFHCLTGRVPFTADNPLTITVKHINEPLPVGMLSSEDVPPSIVQVLLQMTAKKPEERYQSTDKVVEALTNALVAAKLSMPRLYRVGIAQMPALNEAQGIAVGGVTGSNPSRPSNPSTPSVLAQTPAEIVCFRCGASNQHTRNFCTMCGEDLSNRNAVKDTYLVQGRPVLARLTMRTGSMAGRSYRFHQDVTTIGRTNGNNLVISHLSVSRRHARLWFKDGSWYLQDLDSANGTFVNKTRIFQPVVLNEGDIINFGNEEVVFNITYGP